MTVGAAAMDPSSPARTTENATRPTTTRRRSKKTYRTRRRMSLGTIWISIMMQPAGLRGSVNITQRVQRGLGIAAPHPARSAAGWGADDKPRYHRLMPRIAVFLAVLLAAAAHAQTIVWEKYDPMTVRTNRTADAAIEVQTSGTVSGMRLDYANGGSLALTQSGPGHWVASVPAARVLDGYAADDVNHNFVGFLRLLASDGSTLISYNSFIQVVDNLVPSVTIRTLGGNAR